MPYYSQGSMHETVVKNGRVIRDIGADSYSQGDKKHTDFLIKGHDNNMPFIITNMKRLTRSTRRRSTPFYPRRKTGKRRKSRR